MWQKLLETWWVWTVVTPVYLMTGAYVGARAYMLHKEHGNFSECRGKGFFSCDENMLSFVGIHMLGNAFIAFAPIVWPAVIPILIVLFPIQQYMKFCKYMAKDIE